MRLDIDIFATKQSGLLIAQRGVEDARNIPQTFRVAAATRQQDGVLSI